MRLPLLGAAVLALASAFAFPAHGQDKKTYDRRSPMVVAFEKAAPSIAMIRVPQKGADDRVGTGVVYDERGYIVTNAHVVKGVNQVNVLLPGDVNLRGDVVHRDPRIDLAIVKVNHKKSLVAIEFGSAKDLKVGQRVVAIGHPFGFKDSASVGVISAMGRDIDIGQNGKNEWLSGIVQTDAKINPGNSGGPLINHEGKMVALNVAIRQDAQGIAFAINVDMVKAFLDRHVAAVAAVAAREKAAPALVSSPR